MNVSGIELSIHMTIQLSVKCFYCKRLTVYSYFEKGCRKKCARDNLER